MKKFLIVSLLFCTVTINALETNYFSGKPANPVEREYWSARKDDGVLWDVVRPATISEDFPIDAEEEKKESTTRIRPNSAIFSVPDLVPLSAFPSQFLPVRLAEMANGAKKMVDVNERKHENTECPIFNPTLQISLDLRQLMYEGDRSKCAVDQLYKMANDNWQIQKPFYVDEPKWVEIELDYRDTLPHNFAAGDPFFVTRGKKVLQPDGRAIVTSRREANENELLAKKGNGYEERANADWRIFERRIKTRNANGSKRKEEGKKSSGDRRMEEFVRRIEENEDPFFWSRGKKMPTNEEKEEEEEEEEAKEHTTKPLENSKRKIFKLRTHLRRKRSPHRAESHGTSIEGEIKDEKNGKGEVAESKENNSLFDERVLSSLRRSRGKRSFCKDSPCYPRANGFERNNLKTLDKGPKEWVNLKSRYTQARDKHGDILEMLREPYFITRGKKNSRNGDYDCDETTGVCKNSRKVTGNLTKQSKVPRDRRDSIDDLFANYDPFYVSRGKRIQEEEETSNTFKF